MLQDCIEVFKSIPKSQRNKLIIDNYIPADGTYILAVPKDDSFEIEEVLNIKINKKTKEIEGKNSHNFYKFCNLDYNSKLLEMNKCIDSKKIIHSNNYLSFFVKKENLFNGKLKDEVIDGYYALLADPKKKYAKNKGSEVYLQVENEIGEVDTVRIEKIKTWIKENIFNLDEEFTQGKDYLKIFFDYPLEEYIREGKRYFIPNIYNSNDYNFKFDDKILGLPNDNMGMNSKKPYLENKSRGIGIPYALDSENVLIQKEFFDYLMNLVSIGKSNVLISNEDGSIEGYNYNEIPKRDFEGVFLHILKGKNEAEIHDYDIITNFKVNLKDNFYYKDYLDVCDSSEKIDDSDYGIITKTEDFQTVLNKVLFDGCLIRNYFTEAGDMNIKDNCLKNNLLLSRNRIFDYIWKGADNNFFGLLDKVSLSLVKGTVLNGYLVKASHKFNLRLSLLEYKGGINMADILNKTINSVKNKVNADDYMALENDDEYYYATGQTVSYLLSKHKGKNRPLSLAEPFINAKNNKVLKENLRKLYKKYAYDPSCNNKRFKNLYSLVIGYEAESKVNEDMIIAGFLTNNIVYMKEEKEQ